MSKKQGRLAQLVELLPYKQAVTGSSPVPSISKLNNFDRSQAMHSFQKLMKVLDGDRLSAIEGRSDANLVQYSANHLVSDRWTLH
jgi:hypothetical protein